MDPATSPSSGLWQCLRKGDHALVGGRWSGLVARFGYFNFPPFPPARPVIITLILEAKFLWPIPRRLREVSPSIPRRAADPGGKKYLLHLIRLTHNLTTITADPFFPLVLLQLEKLL